MYNFCTLFDSNYLHKGLALYQSLCNVCDEFHLYVVAFDDNCFNTLQNLTLEKLTVVSLSKFETKELLAVKPTRNRAEYCWTCGPSVINHFILNFQLDHCSYLDADMMFFSSPKPIYDEIGENSIALTEHFTEKVDKIGGRFCVQFVYFKNDKDGIEALTWWKDSCIEWCFARFEDGKYGDQKYLDCFPERFKKVCVLKNRGVGVAEWNASQYDFSNYGKINFNGVNSNIIFFHFHGTRIALIDDKLVLSTVTFDIDHDKEIKIYMPYLNLLKSIYTKQLNCLVNDINIEQRKWLDKFYSKIKKHFRKCIIFQYLYFKVLNVKYNGYEGKK